MGDELNTEGAMKKNLMLCKCFLAIIVIALNIHTVAYAAGVEIKLITERLEPSYFTLGAGINISGEGRWNDQMFEGEIDNHIKWWHNPSPLWIPSLEGIMLINPKINLRMYNEESDPVKTPSFLPRLTYFFWRDKDFESEEKFRYNSVMLSHHSNGQAGSFYNSDGTVNTDSGNFSTNYFEFSHYEVTDFNYLPEWSNISIIWHPGFGREDNLDDQYETLKLGIGFQTKERDLCSDDYKYALYGSVSYILDGRDYIIAPNKDFPSIVPKKAEWTDNVNLSAELRIKVPFWDRIGIFVKYDHGFDYYNIHFQERINRIQMGFSGQS